MRISDFVNDYELHDSFIKSVKIDDNNHRVTLFINFAFWMQEGYAEGTPENGIIKVVFYDVKKYECKDGDPAGAFVGILGAEYKDGSLVINLLDDETVSYFDLIITSNEVSVSIVD